MRERLSVNMIANMMSFAVSLLVAMWLTPFIIRSLGSEAYGFIPLTQQLVNYMSVITIALNGMVSRFFTFSIKAGDKDSAERYFNTSLVNSLILSVISSIVLLLIIIYIKRILNVPDSIIFDVRLSLFLYGVIFFLTDIGSSFSMALFCENRMDISGMLGSINTILRSIFIVILLNFFTARLWFVSLGSLIASIIIFTLNIYYFKKLMPGINLNLKKYDLQKLKELFGSGIWSSINYVGAVLFLQIDMLVANWALGAKGAGEYSALLQLSNLLRGFVSTITVVFTPTMIALFAKGKLEELVNYSNKAVKITGIIMALPVGLACGLGGNLISLWLGEEFKGYALLFFLMTIHLSVNLSVQPLFGIFQAANRVRIPAIVTLIMGGVNFTLAIILSITFKLGSYGIVIASIVILTMKNLIFTPLYSSRITGQSSNVYYKGIILPVIGVGAVVIISTVFKAIISINTWTRLFICAGIISSIYLFVVYFLILTGEERNKIKSTVFRRLKMAMQG
ncbi:MATE family efflux transporter [Clostridium thermarum]|uniref:MATE family efflux transporter n=1 Tax=Clostridium thermarum TaxID=1716543 RepID=UPI00111D3801|nr:MATE family efflux transporter [Clostridium thermarum]